MATRRKNPRIPREDGTERLVDATIALGRTTSVAKITIRDMAAAAGLQTIHVKRYFGSRNDLLIAVSNRLMERIVDAVAEQPLPKVFPILQNNLDVSLRLRIVSHLLDEGISPDSFANDRDVYLRIADRISEVNKVSQRTARTYALLIQLVLQGSQLMGDANGLNPKQRKDIFGLLVALAPELKDAEDRIGW